MYGVGGHGPAGDPHCHDGHAATTRWDQSRYPETDQQPQGLEELSEVIDAFIRQSGIPRDRIAGVGIGMPGFVDVRKGINHSFPLRPGRAIL